MSSVPELPIGPSPVEPTSREPRAIDLGGGSLPLIVIADGRQYELIPADLRDDAVVAQLCQAWGTAQPPLVCDMRHILSWSEDDRWWAFTFLVRLRIPYVVRTTDGGAQHPDLFEAAIAMMEGHDNIIRCERACNAAIQAAGLLHSNSIRAACSRIADRLRELRVRGHHIRELTRHAQEVARIAAGNQESHREALHVYEALPDVPCSDAAVVPTGWMVSAEGIRRANDRNEMPLVPAPIVIVARYVGISDGTESLEIAWQRDGQWRRRIVARAVIATARTLVDLAAYGVPVNSNNSKLLVQYLSDYEAVNLEALPCDRVTRQLGWHGCSGREGFLWGRQMIAAGAGSTLDGDAVCGAAASNHQAIIFQGLDDGDEQLVAGYHAAGTYADWLDAMQVLAAFPRVRMAVYASLGTAVLAVVDAGNFIMSYAGPTSRGKSTTARVAASVWGCPNERSARAAIGSWDASRVWIERAAAIQCDLPLILDDTKRARNSRDIAQTLYDVASGRGRGRGSTGGIRETGTFRTVLVTNGEAPITSFTEDGGTRARVLELWGSPFGDANEHMGSVVTHLNEVLMAHYGHAGPRFAQFLAENSAGWAAWREQYHQIRARHMERARGNPVAIRMAAHFALLDLTARLAVAAGVIPWAAEAPADNLWDELTAGTREADRAEVALQQMWSWCSSHREEFFSQRPPNAGAPSGGWAGRWDTDGRSRGDNQEFIGIYPHRVKEVLRGLGFEVEPVLRMWRDRGWLRNSPGRGYYYRTRVAGDAPVDLVAILRSAIDALGADGQEEDVGPVRQRQVVEGPGGDSRAGGVDADAEPREGGCGR